MKKVFAVLVVLFVATVPLYAVSESVLTVTAETWVREVAPDADYENDGLGIYSSASATDQARRYTLLEFDVSGVDAGAGYTGVELNLFSMAGWSSKDYLTLTEAFIIDTSGATIAGMTWNTYMPYDSGAVALDSLGRYDYDTITNEPTAYDTWVTSAGSAADLSAVLAEVAGDGVLTIVIKAVEDGVEYRADWEDDAYYGNRATLTLVPEPATMTLLALGGLALIRRRRS